MIGKTLGNRYEILKKVGEGGMAIVYKARCHLLDRYVAIKVLKSEFNDDEEFIKKFRRESQAAASLSHPNILSIYDVGFEELDDHKVYYIVMEFIDGKTLKQVIKEKGKLTEYESIKYSVQISEALLHAHNNHIIHRDIKPHNIMITSDDRIKVTDFGIARAATSSTVTASTDVLGSVHYFSPEQARGGFTDEKSDIYSLGIVMYEMITGKLPYVGDTPVSVALQHIQNEIKPPKSLNPDISTNYESIILKCTEKTQNKRYGNVSSLISDLNNIKNITPAEIYGDDEISNTILIPAITDDDEIPNDVDNKEDKKDGGIKGIVLGVLLAFLLVTAVFYGISRFRNSFVVDEVEVPYIVGMDEDMAEETITDLGLEFNVVDRVANDEFEEGQVISQSVDEGIKVKEGFTIDVYISLGLETEIQSVPNVRNLTLKDAEELIREAGFRVGGPEYEHHDTVELDHVISQSPEPFEELESGETIYLTVSLGRETKSIIMPRVIDRDVNEARTMLNQLGLRVNITYVDSDEPADIVVWQEYGQGTELEEDSTVNLRVSSGPAPEPDPEPEPEPPVDEPIKEKPVTINIEVHPDKEQTDVEIRRTQDGNTIPVYNQTHTPDEGTIPVQIEAKPGARIDVLFDGVQQRSFVVD